MQTDGEVVLLAKGSQRPPLQQRRDVFTTAPVDWTRAIGCQISGPTPKGCFHQCSFRWLVRAEGMLLYGDDATL